jgi:inner membrane protein
MPTIMTHAVVPLVIGLALGPTHIARPLIGIGAALAMLPDADVVGFAMGIDYASPFGHRGASHSIAVAALTATAVAIVYRPARTTIAWLFLFASMASHGVLDALTNGGLGPALLWPFDDTRYFAPIRPVRVSPIGGGFFSARGLAVMWSEWLWIWCPALLLLLPGWFWRRHKGASRRNMN